MRQPVVQKHPTGCGIAAAACLCQCSYEEMQKIAHAMQIYETDQSLWSDQQLVRRLVASRGISLTHETVEFTDWQALPDLALLALKYHEVDSIGYWHWAVFERFNGIASVLDSATYLTHNRRTDWDAMQPQWFIPVLLS